MRNIAGILLFSANLLRVRRPFKDITCHQTHSQSFLNYI